MTSLHFNVSDFLILGILLLSMLIGVVRGFVKEFISLLVWTIAVIVALLYTEPLSEYMTFTNLGSIRSICAFLLIFVGIIFLGALLNFLVGVVVRKTPFVIPDRVLGFFFGLVRGVALVTICVLLATLTPLTQAKSWRDSYMINKFQVLSIWLRDRLPQEYAKTFQFPEEKEKLKAADKVKKN